jgi:integrase
VILPHLGHRPIGAIKPSEIAAWQKGRMDVLSVNKVVVLRRWVGAIFKAAVLDDLIRVSPTGRLRPLRPTRSRVEPLETEAVARMAAAVPERYRALIVLAAGAGMRQGEVLGLTVDRVDWLRREVKVDRQLVDTTGGVATFGPPKTEASYRTIPLSSTVLAELAEHVRKFPPGDDGLLFTNAAAHPIRRNNFGSVWHPAKKAAGLPEQATSHDLRHYYASLLIQRGASVKTVQARLGHKSAVETLDTYGHLWPEQDEATRQAVDEVLGAALAEFVGSSWDREAVER